MNVKAGRLSLLLIRIMALTAKKYKYLDDAKGQLKLLTRTFRDSSDWKDDELYFTKEFLTNKKSKTCNYCLSCSMFFLFL